MGEKIFLGSILWRNIAQKGHEICQLFATPTGFALEGTSIFRDAEKPCLLNYRINCDPTWQTLSAGIDGWVGKKRILIQLITDVEHHWRQNETENPGLAGCIDLDLNFSPCTNTLPIRRLGLQVGDRTDITAAWLKFPSFSLVPLQQGYERLEESIYRYSSRNGQFVADLKVDSLGFVTDYPGIWIAETG
jgi:hypothetical protein